MKILEYPNDHLRTKTTAVQKVTPELAEIAKEMYKTMQEANGIGLAATQVGLDISLIVLEDTGSMLALFNPVINQRSSTQKYDLEGCLSFPGIFRNIKRAIEVKIKYRDINNKMQYKVLKDIQARALLHEFDHLNGQLFIDLESKEEKLNDEKN